jgi:hypothetical protein
MLNQISQKCSSYYDKMSHLHFHNLTSHASMCRLLIICISIFLETAVSFERNLVRIINRLFLIFSSKVAAIRHPIWNLLYTKLSALFQL